MRLPTGKLHLRALAGSKAKVGDAPLWSGTEWKPGTVATTEHLYPEVIVMSGTLTTGTDVLPQGLLVPVDAHIDLVIFRLGVGHSAGTFTLELSHWDSGSLTVFDTFNVSAGVTSTYHTWPLSDHSVDFGYWDEIHFNITSVGTGTPPADLNVAFQMTAL